MDQLLLPLLSLLLLTVSPKVSAVPVWEPAEPSVLVAESEPADTPEPVKLSTVEDYLSEAKARLESGETEENLSGALSAYETVLKLDNGNVEALLGIADIYIRRGDFDGALAFLKENTGSGTDQAIQSKIAELETGNVNDSAGKIRKVTGDGKGRNAPFVHLYDYDDQDRLIRVTWFDGNGAERDHVDVTYNEEGNPLTRADMVLDGPFAGALIHTEFGYNEQGQNISAKRVLPGEWEEETLVFFDEEGHEIRWETYSNSELVFIDVFEDFDEYGHALKRSMYSGSNELIRTQLREYDYESYTLTVTDYDSDGTKQEWSVETYLPDWITVTDSVFYNADGSVRSEFHTETVD